MMEMSGESTIKGVLRKMDALLSSRAPAWYGGKSVEFVHRSHYVDFEDMLNRELCCADFAVEEKRIACSLRITELAFEFVVNGRTVSRAGETFFESLVAHGRCTAAAGRTATIVIEGKRLECELKMHAKELVSAVAYDGRACSVLRRDPIAVQHWLHGAIRSWLSDEKQIMFSTECKEENGVLTVAMEARTAISTVEIDISTDEAGDVVRWKETSLDEACTGHVDLSRTEALAIIAENDIEIPADTDLTGWYRNEYGGNTNVFILRFEHRIADHSDGYRADSLAHPGGFAEYYRFPGFITVENDFFQCSIDTKNRRVTAMQRKWKSALSLNLDR
jgi:hypothetical protein